MTPEQLEKAEMTTRQFLLRERLGKLCTYHTYMPSVLRVTYIQMLEDIAEACGVSYPTSQEERR